MATKKRKTHRENKKLTRECWDLDYAFLDWIKPRLKKYLKDAEKVVNLEYHIFTRGEEILNQKQVIERMINLFDEADSLMNVMNYSYEEIESGKAIEGTDLAWKKIDEALDWWRIVFPAMWW